MVPTALYFSQVDCPIDRETGRYITIQAPSCCDAAFCMVFRKSRDYG
jgi:hypothetical protein